MLSTEVKMPVAVRAVSACIVDVRVHVQPARYRQPPHYEAKCDQQASSDEFTALLEPHRNLPAEKQHEPGAQGEEHGVSDREPHRETEGARVAGRPKRGRQRQRGNGHEVIGAESVEKAEREHRGRQHEGIIDGFGLWAVDFGSVKRRQPKARGLAVYISTDIYSCM